MDYKKNEEFFIYFIEAFEKGKNITIDFNNEFTLEPFLKKEIKDNDKIYDLNIYRLDKELFDFQGLEYKDIKTNIILQDKNEGEFKALLDRGISKFGNLFLFNFKFIRKTFFTQKVPSGQYSLSSRRQYEIFRELINNKKIAKITELVISAQIIFIIEEEYEFSFFVTVFSDIVYIRELLAYSQIFNLRKIKLSGIVKLEDLFRAKDLIYSNYDNPEEKMIDHIKNKEEKERILSRMGIFLFFFYYQYQKDKLIKLLENKYYNNYIYNLLLEKKKEYEEFNFDLPKDCIKKLFSFVTDFDELLTIFSYNKDILENLEIINENKDIIIKLFEESKKENDNEKNKITFKKNNIKETDNMEKIKIQIEKIFIIEKEINDKIVYFPKIFFETYVDKYDKIKSINNLIHLIEVIELIKKNKKTILNYRGLLKKIHYILMKFASEGKIKDMNIFSFIQNDEFLMNNNDENKESLSLNIFDGIDINLVNDEFMKKWKEIKWLEIFSNSEKEFYEKICNLIKNFKDFNKLFSLFDIDEKRNDYNNLCLTAMKDRFINLLDSFENFSKEENNNFIENASKLIYYLNVKEIPVNELIKVFLINILDKENIHQIYYKIYSNDNYNIFHNNLKDLIFEFYKSQDNIMFINPLYLGFYIKNSEELNRKGLSQLNKYVLEPDEFYIYEEIDKIKLLKKIIESNLIDNKILFEYIQITKAIASIIIEEIIKGECKFAFINSFYSNNKENELFERIKLISCLVDNQKLKKNTNLCQEIIETNMNTLHQIIKDLEIVKKKIKTFFPNSRKNDIREIDKILETIRKNGIFYYKNKKFKEKIDFYLGQKDINNLRLDLNSGNVFFKLIYEEKKRMYENDDIKVMEETEKEINNIINIIQTNSIKNVNINNIYSILNKLSKEEKNNLGKEIDKFVEQYNIKINVDKERLIHEFLLISKKNLIFESADGFLSFIENTGVEQDEFTKINKTIVKYLKDPTDINVIEFSLELFKDYDIEFNEDTNYNYLDIFKMIKNEKKIIKFLIEITLKKCQDLLEYFLRENLDTGNIPCLIVCKTFFDNFLNKNTKDIDIIKSLINGAAGNENLGKNLRKLLDSFEVISNMILLIES